jgi:hypothetical protein
MSRLSGGPTRSVRVVLDSPLTQLITVLRDINIATLTPVTDTVKELIYKRKNNGRPPPDDELLVRIKLTAYGLAKIKFDKLFPFDSFALLDEYPETNSPMYKRIYKEINRELALTGLRVFFISRYSYNTLSIRMEKTSLEEGPSSGKSSRESSGEGPSSGKSSRESSGEGPSSGKSSRESSGKSSRERSRERSRESSGERQGERQGERSRESPRGRDRSGGNKKRSRKMIKYTKQKRYTKTNLI